jgi:MFS transporter, DHA1 family, multidrug resistance protein
MPEHGHLGQRTGVERADVPDAGPQAAAVRRTGLLVTLLLGGLTATPPLAMDMYLPSLPEVTDALHAPPSSSPSPPVCSAWPSGNWWSAR